MQFITFLNNKEEIIILTAVGLKNHSFNLMTNTFKASTTG